METAIIVVALIAFVAFRQWLDHHRRIMLHRERLAAIEKGIEPPSLEQEVRHRALNVQRILLLAGLVWMALGLGIYAVLQAMLSAGNHEVLPGLQFLGVAPAAVGVAHLIAYMVGERRGWQ